MKNSSRTLKVAGAAVATLALAIAPLAPAQAAGTGSWGVWNYNVLTDLADSTIAFNDATYIDATFTVANADDVEVLNVDDEGEYFTAETPIGAAFGANGPSATNNFLKVHSPDNKRTDVTTTVTFASPVAAGTLGFAASDIDYDHVTVTATDANGAPVSGADLLGTAADTAAFNFCNVTSTPDGCSDNTTAVPLITVNATDVVATGDVTNYDGSDGSTVWFRPTVAISTVTFVYRNDDRRSPSTIRYWFVQGSAPELANTGQSASTMFGIFGIGAALLAAGAVIVMRRRQA